MRSRSLRTTAMRCGMAALLMAAVLVPALAVGQRRASAATTITVTSNANAGAGTLRQAIIDGSTGGSAAGSDITIVIQAGLAPIALTSGLEYDGGTSNTQNLVIQGNGATITGNDTFRLLYAGSSGTVTIDSVTMSHGSRANGGGGALFTAGNTTITNSTFRNNHNGYWGGAIASFPSSGAMTISNSVFEDNDAGFAGGALNSNWNIVVTDSVFTNNSTSYAGGAISASGTVDVTGSTFTGNIANGGSGGAISANGGSAVASTFTDNTTSQAGGGVYFTGAATITGSTFTGNEAATSGGGATMYGRGSVTNSTFDSNLAGTGGGGLYYAAAPNVLEVSGTTISNNSVTNGNGGGIQVEAGLHLVNSTITGNLASGTSGAIHSYSWYDPQFPQYATQPYTITLDFSTVSGNGAATAGNFGTDSPQVVTLVTNASVISDPRTAAGVVGGSNCVLTPAATATASVSSDSSCFSNGGTNLVSTVAAIDLAALADNGGTTPTMLPGATSVLVEFVATNPVGSVTTDQRGVARTLPMTAGAVEVDREVPPTTTSTTTTVSPTDPVVPIFAG